MSYAAVSVDGLYTAIVRGGELSLYTVEPLVEIARTQLAASVDRTLAFVGRHVLVHDTTRLAIHSMQQRLAMKSQLELDPPARLVTTSQHYALLARPDATAIATFTSEGAALAPTRTPLVVDRAVGLDNARFLTWPKKGPAEMWDASTRLPIARIGLELPPDTIDVGMTGKHRSVWIATAGGDLVVSRLSDGKATIASLPRPPQQIASHPGSAWLVMDFDGVPHAVNCVLRTFQRLDIPAGRPRALAPSVGSHAYIIVDEGGEIARYEVGVDTAPKVVRIAVGGPLPDGEDVVATAPPTPVVRVQQRQIDVEPVAESPAPSLASRFAQRSEPAVTPAPEPASPLASRFGARDREPGQMRPFGAARPAPADWHAPLLEWWKRAQADAPGAELPAIAPLVALADRAKLETPARRILFALAADWIAGRGDVGLAASKLGDIGGSSAWQEALGNGQLGKLGLVRSEVGRCLLVKPAGTFFDGRDPVHATRLDGAGRRDGIADGAYRVRPTVTHAQLAAVLGTIGIGSFEGDKARLDAWLRAWPAVLVAMTPTELRPGELVVVTAEIAGLPDLPGV